MNKNIKWIPYLILISVVGYIIGAADSGTELGYWLFFNFDLGHNSHKILRQSKDIINVSLALLAVINVFKPNKLCVLLLLSYFLFEDFIIYKNNQIFNSNFIFWFRSTLPLLLISQLFSKYIKLATLLKLVWVVQVGFFAFVTINFRNNIVNELRNIVFMYSSIPVSVSQSSSLLFGVHIIAILSVLIIATGLSNKWNIIPILTLFVLLSIFPARYPDYGISELVFYSPLLFIPFVNAKLRALSMKRRFLRI
jgi:hypothetical protein